MGNNYSLRHYLLLASCIRTMTIPFAVGGDHE